MFTGLIEEIGEIGAVSENKAGRRLKIVANQVLSDLQLGDSIAVDGVCLTVEKLGADYFEVQAVGETLSRSTLVNSRRGDRVNLERAMAASDRFGGHFVQGHVDAVGTIVAIRKIGEAAVLQIAIPESINNYIVEKGSLTVNGISLTVAEITDKVVKIALIPVTLSATNLGLKKVNDEVNLEVDILAKYVEKMINAPNKKPLTFEKVKGWGFD
ncbi:MAG: riboflavin synthase [Candidatus Marinimicrobia bacterium]|nr:riboflavin synthase [Candidatus Neomarinimicrobiota bacterium]